MTIETTTRAGDLRSATTTLWAIGRDNPAGEIRDFPVSWADWRRDVAWAEIGLAQHGVGPGSAVLIVASMAESPWFDPVETAALRLGALYSLGETAVFEAFRSQLYARALAVDVVFGLNRTIASALGDELAASFGGVRTILARPDTVPLLRAAGLPALTVTRLGPALALDCPFGAGAHLNGAEWAVAVDDGELLLSTTGDRARRLERERVGVRGEVISGVCPCGRADPRVLVAPDRDR